MADDSEEAIEASANPLRWPDPSRPIINQRLGPGGPGGEGSAFHGGVNIGGGGAAGIAGSGGRAGMGGIPTGAGSRRDDDEEADRARSWLVEDEDVFGDDRLAAPPVIGGDRLGGGDGDGG